MKRETHTRSLETLAEKFEMEASAASFNRHNKADKALYWRGVEDANLKAARVIRKRIEQSDLAAKKGGTDAKSDHQKEEQGR